MRAAVLLFLCLQSCIAEVSASEISGIPDWLKYPIFFVGVALLASLAWFIICCSCMPCGCIFKASMVFIIVAIIGVWGYFMFGPWWVELTQS